MFPNAPIVARALLIAACMALATASFAQSPSVSDISEPVSVAIVVDDSADQSSSAGAVREAVKTFVSDLRDGDEYAVVTATDKAGVAQDFTDDAELAEPALKRVAQRRRNVVFDGIMAAVEYLKSNAGNDRKAILLISSGADEGSRAAANDVASAARDAAVPIYAIAATKGSWQSNASLQQLAQATGGDAYFPAKRSEFDDVSAAAAGKLFGGTVVAGKQSAKPLSGYSGMIVRSIPVSTTRDTTEFPNGDNVLLQKLLVSRL
jgi:VWFA-related protein